MVCPSRAVKSLGFVLRRLASGALTVLSVATLCFVVIHLLPGDPADAILGETALESDRLALRHALHLDLPLGLQYLSFLSDLVFHHMGRSFAHPDRTAWDEVLRVWPSTVILTLSAAAIAWTLALPAALVSAVRPHTRTDAAVGILSLLGMALPSLWIGPLLISLFCVALPILPFPGPDATGLGALVLPAITLGGGMAGILTRMGRSALREVLREPYITAARARGLSTFNVLVRHALRSAMVPLLTVGGAQLAGLLGGAFVTEKIFDRPGLGLLFLEALTRRDIPVVLGCVVTVSLTVVLVQLAVDLAYALVDPRIRVA